MDKVVLDFLKKCNIPLTEASELNGLMIPRNILLDPDVYKNIQPHIVELKKRFSSSSLTALQKEASSSQKWPLLNLVRQILKANNYNMVPWREANGRTKEGKKKYKRFFKIKKFKAVTEIPNES
jgi:hypothetical protein